MFPAPVIHNADSQGQSQDSHADIEDGWTRINQAGGKTVQMFGTRDVVEDTCCGEFSPYDGNKTKEEDKDEGTDGGDPRNDLATG